MQKTKCNVCTRALGLFCAVVLVLTALFVPLTITSGAAVIPVTDDQTVTFSFEEAENPVITIDGSGSINMTRGDDGIGCVGWGIRPVRIGDKWALGNLAFQGQDWANPGGYRLNNNDGVYKLEPATTYVVTLKAKVSAAPDTESGSIAGRDSYITLGTGFTASTSGGTEGARLSGMNTVYSDVIRAEVDAELFTLTDASGSRNLPIGDTWYDATYVFTTPETMTGDTSLGFFGSMRAGADMVVDDVAVTKVGSGKGVIVAIDEYYGTTEVYTGTTGTTQTLPTLTSETEGHEFKGWYNAEDVAITAPVEFAADTKIVHTKWDAPVTVTLVDKLNNTSTPIGPGREGETFTYPADPVDPAGVQWFMGWCTTEDGTVEYTNNKYPAKDLTLYALWKGENVSYTEGFENYTADDVTETKNDTNLGGKVYKNSQYFGIPLKIVSDQKAAGDYSLRFNFDGDMVKDPEDPETYDAAGRWNAADFIAVIDNSAAVLDNNVAYKLKFKYYLGEGTTGDVRITLRSSAKNDIWAGGSKKYGNVVISKDTEKGKWLDAEIPFTPAFEGASKYMYICFNITAAGDDADIYVDELEFTPVSQPNQTTLTLVYNNGEADKVTAEQRNTAISLPATLPDNGDAKFLGWYADENLTIPFTQTTFGRKGVVAYAKWSMAATHFDNYSSKYVVGNNLAFNSDTMSIVNEAGAGANGDDYYAKFSYEGSKPFYNGGTLSERYDNRDLCFQIAPKLSPNTTYIATFYVKVNEGTNIDFMIKLAGGEKGNIWGSYYTNLNTKIYIDKAVTDGWVKKQVVFTTPAEVKGDITYAMMAVADNSPAAKVEAQIDMVSFIDASGVIALDGNGDNKATSAIESTAGTVVTLPTEIDSTYGVLSGWSTDKEGTNIVTSVTATEGVVTVYAQWKPFPKLILDGNIEDVIDQEIIAKVGDIIDLPQNLTSADGQFVGWATDAAGDNMVEGTTFTMVDGTTTLYAVWFKSTAVADIMTFKDYPYAEKGMYCEAPPAKTSLAFGQLDTVMIKDEAGQDGEAGYLHFDWYGDRDYYNQSVSKKLSERPGARDFCFTISKNLKANTSYVIEYYVRAEKMDCEFAVNFNFCGAGSWSGTFQKVATSNVSYSDLGKGWVKKTVAFTSPADLSGGKTLYGYFTVGSSASDAVVLADVDSFKITVCSNLVTFETNTSLVDDSFQMGNPGEKISFPDLAAQVTSRDFEGWYLDAAFSTPVTGNEVITLAPQTFYANWGAAPIDFNGYPYAGYLMTFGPGLSIVNQPGVGADDNYAAKFDYLGGRDWYQGGEKFYNRANSIDMCMQLDSATLKDKTPYLLTVWVRVEEANANFSYNVLSNFGGNIWNPGTRTEMPESTITITPADVGKGWVKKQAVFVTNLKEKDGKLANTLYGYLTVDSSSPDAKVVAYIDNISYSEITSDLVVYSSNVAGVEGGFQFGKEGDTLVFPTVTNGEHKFLGWYSDDTGYDKFYGTTMPKGLTFIYAKWGALPVTFEGYEQTNTNYFSIGQVYDFVDTGYDDNIALRFKYNSEEKYYSSQKGDEVMADRYNSIDSCCYLTPVKQGTVYKVGLYYKVLSANVKSTIGFATGNKGNIWGSNTRYPSVIEVGTQPTDWTYAEVILQADLKSAGANYLFILGAAANAERNKYANVLIDNVLIEQIDPPYVFFDGLNDKAPVIVQGDPGQAITYPAAPVKFGHVFAGWYLDKELTIPFTAKVFNKGDRLTAYAKYNRARTVKYDFEYYTCEPENIWKSQWYIANCETKKVGGNTVMAFDKDVNKGLYGGGCFASVAYGKEGYTVDKNKKYLVTFKYMVAKKADGAFEIGFTSAASSNYWHRYASLCSDFKVKKNTEVGKWFTGTVVLDGARVKEENGNIYNTVFITCGGGRDGLLYVDDIVFTEYAAGETAYVIESNGAEGIPSVISGRIGSSFANLLPENPVLENHAFKGYYYIDIKNGNYIKLDNMVFEDDAKTIVARFVRLETLQDFETGFPDIDKDYPAFGIMDFDYEIYDASKEGNSLENVTSGTKSLHRKGETPFFENIQILSEDLAIVEGERYTVTFKVKMPSYKQTDGAIKFASGRSPYYAWTTNGDYYAAVAIADLVDGQWHEVTYTFNAVESYLSFQTPGYCELFIDDILIKRAEDGATLSTNVNYTEYIPALRDAEGNVIGNDAASIDVSKIIDDSLGGKSAGWLIYVLIGGGAVVLLAAVALVLIFLKKRKAKKA